MKSPEPRVTRALGGYLRVTRGVEGCHWDCGSSYTRALPYFRGTVCSGAVGAKLRSAQTFGKNDG
eukprot:scaffold133389_cov39-Prasinocladus_malaysianus.AAC.1